MEHQTASNLRLVGSQSPAMAEQPTRVPASLREADHLDLVPVDRSEFLVAVSPCLSLTAPVGMSEEERDLWFEAAFVALEGVPIGLLKRGALHAMRTADHYSKIVPAIMAEIEEPLALRHRLARYSITAPTALPAPLETAEEKAERREVGAMMKDLVADLEAKCAAQSASGRR